MRGVSLDEIAAATRISTRFLEALENEQWERLPGGAFNRGFIRSIARFLGIDEDGLVAEYAYERRDAEAVHSAGGQAGRIPRDWQPAVVTIIALLAVIGGGFLTYHRYGAAIAARLHARFSSAAVQGQSGAALVDGAPANSPAQDPAPVSGPPVVLSLTMQASKPVDVSVTADGASVFGGKLDVNESKQFEAHDTLEVSSSDSDALTLSLNGRAIHAAASGPQGKITLTRGDLQAAAEASH